jgi:hypothetical protein
VGTNLLKQRSAVPVVAHVAIAVPVAVAIRIDGGMACLSRCRTRGLTPRRDQLPLRRCEHPLESHDDEIADEVRMDVSRTAPNEVLLKPRDAVADGGFDLAL